MKLKQNVFSEPSFCKGAVWYPFLPVQKVDDHATWCESAHLATLHHRFNISAIEGERK